MRTSTRYRTNKAAIGGIPILSNLYGLVIIGLLAVDQARGYQIFLWDTLHPLAGISSPQEGSWETGY